MMMEQDYIGSRVRAFSSHHSSKSNGCLSSVFLSWKILSMEKTLNHFKWPSWLVTWNLMPCSSNSGKCQISIIYHSVSTNLFVHYKINIWLVLLIYKYHDFARRHLSEIWINGVVFDEETTSSLTVQDLHGAFTGSFSRLREYVVEVTGTLPSMSPLHLVDMLPRSVWFE